MHGKFSWMAHRASSVSPAGISGSLLLQNSFINMGTRITSTFDPNRLPHSPHQAASTDVWIPQNDVIDEWGMWDRLIARSEEVLQTGALTAQYFQQLENGRICACLNAETKQPVNRCVICYGTTLVGGFEQYGYATTVLDAAYPSWDASNIALGGRTAPQTMQLVPGATSGTLISPRFLISDNKGFTKSQLIGQDGIRQLTQSGLLAEYTTDEENWFSMDDTGLLNEPTLAVRYRITITRKDTNTESPFMQVFRTRFQMLDSPVLKFSKNAFPDQRFLESIGVRVKLDGVTFWTTPTFGNPSGPLVRVREDDFFEVTSGIYSKMLNTGIGQYPPSGRFKPATVQYVEPASHLISQRWNIRILQNTEIENSVW